MRTAVVTVGAFACGAVIGTLTFMANGNIPGAVLAVLAGLVALGGALVALHVLIGR